MYNCLILSVLGWCGILSRQNTLQDYVYIEGANISVFQALVFALFVFSDFFIFCGANAGK